MLNSKNLALAIAAPFLWGTTFTLAKPAVEHFPPLLVMFFAYVFVALATQFVPGRVPLQTPWMQALLIATLGVTLQGALLFTAIKDVDATTANLLMQTQVPAAVLMGWLFIGEPLTRRKMIGTAIALCGVAIVIGLPDRRPPLIPVIMIVASGVIWSAGQVFVRKFSRDSGLMILRSNALYSLPQIVVVSLLLETGQWQAITSASVSQWLNLAVVCIIGFYAAYYCWFTLLKRVPVDEAVPFVLLMTPFGILAAVLFLGESMSAVQATGAIVLMSGLAIVNGLDASLLRRLTRQKA